MLFSGAHSDWHPEDDARLHINTANNASLSLALTQICKALYSTMS